jgi:hypothetical protein
MNNTDDISLDTPRKPGQQLTAVKQQLLVTKMVDLMTQGLYSTNALSKKLKVDRRTIERWRPLADKIIGRDKIDRNAIRNLQIKRTYELIEMLMNDLRKAVTVKERSALYGNIFKFSSHLALITGINIETTVQIDPTKLVIIRSKPQEDGKRTVIDVTEQSTPVTE